MFVIICNAITSFYLYLEGNGNANESFILLQKKRFASAFWTESAYFLSCKISTMSFESH